VAILRDWSYRYQWMYDLISRLAALSVGGEARFRQLALQGLTINPETKVLDLCCGSGQATQVLVQPRTLLDWMLHPVPNGRSRMFLKLIMWKPLLKTCRFNQFDLVHTSAALHEMEPSQLWQILKEVYRVLKPAGVFTLVDFHAPSNWIFWPGLSLFLCCLKPAVATVKTDLAGLWRWVFGCAIALYTQVGVCR